MKSLTKSALLSGVMILSLTGCSYEKTCYCLETGDVLTYEEGKCYQVTRSDVVETFFVYNPDGKDVAFVEAVDASQISFTDGLAGKRIESVMRMSDSSFKITIYGQINDPEATFGYIKVRYTNFKALSERAKDAYLFAYVAIGDQSGLVDKPVEAK